MEIRSQYMYVSENSFNKFITKLPLMSKLSYVSRGLLSVLLITSGIILCNWCNIHLQNIRYVYSYFASVHILFFVLIISMN